MGTRVYSSDLNSAGYLSNICLFKRIYDYKNLRIIIGLWADIDFKPKIVLLSKDQEYYVSFDYNEYEYYFSQYNLCDQYKFLYCSKNCSFEITPQLMEILTYYSVCIHLYLDYLSSLDKEVKNCMTYFKDLIRIHALLSPDSIYKMCINNCDKYSILEHEMLKKGFNYFLPYIILKTSVLNKN